MKRGPTRGDERREAYSHKVVCVGGSVWEATKRAELAAPAGGAGQFRDAQLTLSMATQRLMTWAGKCGTAAIGCPG